MSRSITTALPAFLAALLATGGLALAQQQLDVRRDVKPDGVVEISNLAGSVEVTTWGRSQVEVTGELGKGSEELSFEVHGDRTEIEVKLPHGSVNNVEGSKLVVKIPDGSSLVVETISADIDAECSGPRVTLQSVSGSLRLRGSPEDLELQSVSGSIDVSGADRTRQAELQTVSGGIHYRGGVDPDGSLEMQSISGTVRLSLSGDVSGRFEVETFSGSIHNGLTDDRPERSSFLPSSSLSFTLGSGGARVTVESFSGGVHLERGGAGEGSSRSKRKRWR